MGEKILLDSEIFKALASQTRLGILKELDERKKTVTELSRIMDLNKATIYEHLNILNMVGLVSKIDSSNKWVYYKLTWRGTDLLHPEKKRIAIVLSLALSFLITGMISFLAYMNQAAHNYNDLPVIGAPSPSYDYSVSSSIFSGIDGQYLVIGIFMFSLFSFLFIISVWLWKTRKSPVLQSLSS